MNNDIKEILEDVKRHLDYVDATKQASIRDNEMKVMYDYITNLQEENKSLKSQLDFIEEQNKYIDKLKKKIKDLQEQIKATEEVSAEYIKRNDKTIEYIVKHTDELRIIRIPKIEFDYNDLLNILKGDSNE